METEINQERRAGPAFQHGEIKHLERDANYGLIESNDGQRIYFERRCVIGVDFYQLRKGDRVMFSEKHMFGSNIDRLVPQATTVYLAGGQAFLEW